MNKPAKPFFLIISTIVGIGVFFLSDLFFAFSPTVSPTSLSHFIFILLRGGIVLIAISILPLIIYTIYAFRNKKLLFGFLSLFFTFLLIYLSPYVGFTVFVFQFSHRIKPPGIVTKTQYGIDGVSEGTVKGYKFYWQKATNVDEEISNMENVGSYYEEQLKKQYGVLFYNAAFHKPGILDTCSEYIRKYYEISISSIDPHRNNQDSLNIVCYSYDDTKRFGRLILTPGSGTIEF